MVDNPIVAQKLDDGGEATTAQRQDRSQAAQPNQTAAAHLTTLKTLGRLRIGIPLGSAALLGALGPEPRQDWFTAVLGVVICQLMASRAAVFVHLALGMWRPNIGSYARAAVSILTGLVLLSVGDVTHSVGVKLAALVLVLTAIVWPFVERFILRSVGYGR